MKESKVIDDWVDRDEVRALAAKLLAPAGEPARSLDDSVYGEEFEGFTGPVIDQVDVVPVVEPEPEPVESGVEEVVQPNPFAKEGGAGKPSAPAPGVVSSPFRAASVKKEKPATSPAAPLASFVTWLKGEIPLEAAMIRGEKERVYFDDLQDGKLLTVAGMLAQAAHQKESEGPRAMVVKLGSKKVMQIIPFVNGQERCFAGLILPRPLADGGVAAFHKALTKAMV